MPERVTVHMIGNAHIDPVWRWRRQEGDAETPAPCRTAVDRMRDTPDFIFSGGAAATYAWIEEADPALFEEIARYVREGRWRISNRYEIGCSEPRAGSPSVGEGPLRTRGRSAAQPLRATDFVSVDSREEMTCL